MAERSVATWTAKTANYYTQKRWQHPTSSVDGSVENKNNSAEQGRKIVLSLLTCQNCHLGNIYVKK